jgi:23S rRNA pseudouridine2457 synthase
VAKLIRFFKPFRVLSQFTDANGRATLAEFIDRAGVYPAGRLDFDSEGLLLLTDDGAFQARIAHPDFKLEKTYLVQVEGHLEDTTLDRLLTGVVLRDGLSRALHASRLDVPPAVPARVPPIPPRYEARHTWLKIVLNTGRNRQVRRMLAAVGHPVLRLVRSQIGPWNLGKLSPGEWTEESVHLPALIKSASASVRSDRRQRSSSRPNGRR